MKKIYLILIIGILLVGTIAAISLSIFEVSKSDFKTKITTISSSLFYDKLVEKNKIDLKEVPENTTLNLEDSGLDISQNKEGVIRVRAE